MADHFCIWGYICCQNFTCKCLLTCLLFIFCGLLDTLVQNNYRICSSSAMSNCKRGYQRKALNSSSSFSWFPPTFSPSSSFPSSPFCLTHSFPTPYLPAHSHIHSVPTEMLQATYELSPDSSSHWTGSVCQLMVQSCLILLFPLLLPRATTAMKALCSLV